MKSYPNVLGESYTLDRVLAGASLARYGDGEFKMCRGSGIKSQEANPELSKLLGSILKDSGDCLVGIPNIHSETPKADFWGKHQAFSSLLVDRPYVSSFVTRPDSAPWINTPDYWERIESLWKGQAITLVRGSSKCLTSADVASASEITEIIAPKQHAFADYDALMERIGKPKRAIICLGPTATVMAVDLCARGVHAIDLGHVALFLRKYRRGEPMSLTKDDKERAA